MTALLARTGAFRRRPRQSGQGLGGRDYFVDLGARLILVGLIVLAGWITAGLVWTVIVPAPASVGGSATLSSATAGGRSPSGGLQNRPQLSFFGVGAVPEAAVSSGPYSLSGILFTADQATSRAIIRVDQNDRIYAVGDKLPNGHIVASVEKDRVILQTAIGREALALPQPDLGGTSATTATANAEPPDPTLAALSAPATVDSSMLTGGALAAQYANLKISLIDGNGSAGGAQLDDVSKSDWARSLGLQNGDIVASVNGIPVQGQASTATILETLSNGSPADVVIIRNGRATHKTVNIVNN